MKKAFYQIHIAVLLWGFTGILGKAISLSAPVLVWYRMFVTALIFAAIITHRGEWVRFSKKNLLKVSGIGIMYAIHWVAFYIAIKYANASIGMVCMATASVFTALMDPLVNKGKFSITEMMFSLIAVAGVFCIYALQPHEQDAAHPMINFQVGVAFGVLASIISAVFTVLNKPLSVQYPARTLVFAEMFSGLIFLSILAPFFISKNPEAVLLPQGYDYLWIFLLSYCCTVWAQSLAMSALRKLSAFTVTLSVNLEPVYGIILAFLIFKENKQLGLGFYLGMGLIFASLMMQVTYVLYRNNKKKSVIETVH